MVTKIGTNAPIKIHTPIVRANNMNRGIELGEYHVVRQLKTRKHFTLVLHQINPNNTRKTINESNKSFETRQMNNLTRTLNISMKYSDRRGTIITDRKRLMIVLSKFTRFTNQFRNI
ncbi:hypothetical protein CsSME_00035839 [Camellia sinensis var. sinensis]